MTQDPFNRPPPTPRQDTPASRRELPQAAGHARAPLVDEDALRGREFPGEFADEPLLILVEPLELRLDAFPPGEESADRRNQEPQSLAAGHLAPHAPQDHRRVLVDQGDLTADFPGGSRRGDHFVPDPNTVLVCDPHLELGQESEDGEAVDPGLRAHQRLVPRRAELEGDDLRTAGMDLRSDRSVDVNDLADAEKRDHPSRRTDAALYG